MSGSTIGIKTADREYYPILQEGDAHKKRLVLTTVRDDQTSVQIDVYRGPDETLEHAEYVGSLMIENVQPAAAGQMEIELFVQLGEDGNLKATAVDLSTGQRQSLSVELTALAQGETYDIPDFELDEDLEGFEEDEEEEEEEEEQFATQTWEEEPPEEPHRRPEFEPLRPSEPEPERRRLRPVAIVGFVFLGLVVIFLITALILWLFRGDDVPALFARRGASDTVAEAAEPEPAAPSAEAEQQLPEPEPEPEPQAAEPEAETEPPTQADDTQASPPEAQSGAPTRVETGLWYRLRWGDTLWDLSASFYRTPWLYGKIARANDIENPDLIYAGSSIFIPKD